MLTFLRARREAAVSLGFIAALWQVSSYFLPPILAPSLLEIARELWNIVGTRAEVVHIAATVARILVSLVLSFLIGGVFGLLMALFPAVRRYGQPLLHMIQGVPALSWVVFAVIWFAQPEVRILFVLVITAVPNFALHLHDAVRGIPRDLWELTRAFRATMPQTVKTLVVPAVTPDVLTAWKVNVGNATRVAVVAELVGATLGVGYQLLSAQQVFNMAAAIAWTIVLVVSLGLIHMVLERADARLLRWRPAREGAD